MSYQEFCGLTKHPFIVSQFHRSEVRVQCGSAVSLLLVLQGWNQIVAGYVFAGGSGDKSSSSFRLMEEFRTKFPVSLLPVGWGSVLSF